MGFVKVVKNKAYFKRFQTKFRRRREAKTDYYARKRLIMSDKNKYDTPKYRFVVRFTNRDVICQIFAAELCFDRCIAAAYGHELTRYGLKAGFNNFPASYCTGLLLARKVNALKNLPFKGRSKVDGTYYNIGDAENEKVFADDGVKDGNNHDGFEKNPFKAYLDVGLHRTTTGCRLFACVKGACDGGLNIPHGTRRFPGTDKEKHETDFEVVKKYIFGNHLKEYMESIEGEEEIYQRQFSKYIAAKITPDSLEALYKSVHAAIRADTFKVENNKCVSSKTEPLKSGYFGTRKAAKKVAAAVKDAVKKVTKPRLQHQRKVRLAPSKLQQKSTKLPISVQQRKNRIKQIIGARDSKIAAAKAAIEAANAAANASAAAAAAGSADAEKSGSGSGSGSESGSESD